MATTILGVLSVFYIVAAAFRVLPIVRRPLMHWYNSQMWIISGTGPVDILLKQIGFRLTFELFIFGIACVFGALGGWLLTIRKNPRGDQADIGGSNQANG
ncbi:hypothetical protein [Methylocapsa acidiphila]|uniref:hypothetical protein n=1 Tax=Methylocapsa acidiphila TaxID=133552 RepID=UPI0003FAC18E|nr:hypothetical protein [Methylocapsa acidiphila]